MKIPFSFKFMGLGVFMAIATNGFALNCLNGWQYSVPITVTNNVSYSLNDFQVKITLNTAALISAGKMISTGDDIRFVDANSCNNLNYWIESGINNSSTVIWVKLPTLPSGSKRVITMYYGNPTAPSASNGDSTFLVFDDFNGSSVNSAKWSTYASATTFSVSGSKLTMTTGSGSSGGTSILVSTASFNSPITAEANVTSTSGFWSSLAILNSGTWQGYFMYCGDASAGANAGMRLGEAYSAGGSYAGHFETQNTNPGTETGLWQMFWPTNGSQTMIWPGGSTSSSQSDVSLTNSVQLAFGNVDVSIGSTTYDWVRARQYAATEPTTSLGVEHNTGINEQNFNDNISIYPNPAHDFMYIDLSSGNADIQTVQILDMNGRLVKTIEISNANSNIAIPSNDFVKGMYFIRLMGKENIFVQKVLVE